MDNQITEVFPKKIRLKRPVTLIGQYRAKGIRFVVHRDSIGRGVVEHRGAF